LTTSGSLNNSFPSTNHSPALLQKCIWVSFQIHLNNHSSVFESAQVSDAHVSTGLTSTLYISFLVFLDIKCDFWCFLSPWKYFFADYWMSTIISFL
jgi:hypothetical protein